MCTSDYNCRHFQWANVLAYSASDTSIGMNFWQKLIFKSNGFAKNWASFKTSPTDDSIIRETFFGINYSNSHPNFFCFGEIVVKCSCWANFRTFHTHITGNVASNNYRRSIFYTPVQMSYLNTQIGADLYTLITFNTALDEFFLVYCPRRS